MSDITSSSSTFSSLPAHAISVDSASHITVDAKKRVGRSEEIRNIVGQNGYNFGNAWWISLASFSSWYQIAAAVLNGSGGVVRALTSLVPGWEKLTIPNGNQKPIVIENIGPKYGAGIGFVSYFVANIPSLQHSAFSLAIDVPRLLVGDPTAIVSIAKDLFVPAMVTTMYFVQRTDMNGGKNRTLYENDKSWFLRETLGKSERLAGTSRALLRIPVALLSGDIFGAIAQLGPFAADVNYAINGRAYKEAATKAKAAKAADQITDPSLKTTTEQPLSAARLSDQSRASLPAAHGLTRALNKPAGHKGVPNRKPPETPRGTYAVRIQRAQRRRPKRNDAVHQNPTSGLRKTPS